MELTHGYARGLREGVFRVEGREEHSVRVWTPHRSCEQSDGFERDGETISEQGRNTPRKYLQNRVRLAHS